MLRKGLRIRLIGAPGKDELSLMLRGFLIRLMALDGQLEDNKGIPPPHLLLAKQY